MTSSSNSTTTVTSSISSRPSLLQSMLNDPDLNIPLAPQQINIPTHSTPGCAPPLSSTQYSQQNTTSLRVSQEHVHVPLDLPLAVPVPSALVTAKKKTKKGAPQVTPEGLQHELLGRQLNMAQTKITSLDSQLSEIQNKNLILEARIKLFEDKENTTQFNNYFPSPSSQCSPPMPASSPQH